jgi:hypothetical protein
MSRDSWRRCAEPACPFVGPWHDYCPEHREAHSSVGTLRPLLDLPPISLDRRPEVALPCTRCRSRYDIDPGALLCHNCQRDERRAQHTDDEPGPVRGMGSHVANALPERDR